MRVWPTNTTDQVKKMLESLIGIPPSRQRLLHRGEEMQDGRTLFEYNVDEHPEIDLRMRPADPGTGKGGSTQVGGNAGMRHQRRRCQ